MRIFLISDNADTREGLRLAGIDGVVVHEASEVERELRAACENPKIGIVLITAKLINLCPDLVYELKMSNRQPLILEVSDRHGAGKLSDSITKYVREAVGITI